MKRILTFLLLVITLQGYSQTYPWMIRISPDQNVDTANVGVFYPSGNGNLTGRLHVVSYENFADRIAGFLTTGNWFNTNLTQTGNRSHDAAGYDTQLDNQGEFKLISDIPNKNIWLEKTNSGGSPINSLKITQNDIQLNSDDGVNVSSLTMGDAFIFANNNGSYVFGDGFTPVPDDNTVTKVLGLDASGYLRQKDVSSIGGASYLVYTAILTQSGTSDPTATVIKNTLGGTVVWTRDGTGLYLGTLTDAFAGNVVINQTVGVDAGYGLPSIYFVYIDSDDAIGVNTYSDYGSTPSDDIMTGHTYVEVTVYP